MKNKLINMTDFVLNELEVHQSLSEFKELVRNYAKLLKQPLQLGFFVPTDEEGNVLSEPKFPHTYASENTDIYVKQFNKQLDAYRQACNRVLFESDFRIRTEGIDDKLYLLELYIKGKLTNVIGYFYKKDGRCYTGKNIEDIIELNLLLTPTALKQIYG